MSDDIPIIFAQDVRDPGREKQRTAVFLSAISASQMQQYAIGGWGVTAASGFDCKAGINLAEVPAATVRDEDIVSCTLLSCEAPNLKPDTSACIAKWRPDLVKINCAFHGVSDASLLAAPLSASGYTILGAVWRDDNSFGIRSFMSLDRIESIKLLEWDRINLIGVRDAAHAQVILTVARLYAGEEKRISELRVAKAIRDDYIGMLEDALMAHQQTGIFKGWPRGRRRRRPLRTFRGVIHDPEAVGW